MTDLKIENLTNKFYREKTIFYLLTCEFGELKLRQFIEYKTHIYDSIFHKIFCSTGYQNNRLFFIYLGD